MAEPMPPPPRPPPSQHQGHCGTCTKLFDLSEDHKRSFRTRDLDGLGKCSKCPNMFHRRCATFKGPSFICAECRLRSDMMGLVKPGAAGDEETKDDEDDEDARQERRESDEEYVPDEVDEEMADDELQDETVSSPVRTTAPHAPASPQATGDETAAAHAATPAAAQETNVAATSEPSVEWKRPASTGASARPQPRLKHPKAAPKARQLTHEEIPLEAAVQRAALGDADWSDAETVLLAKAVRAFKMPSPDQVKEMYDTLAEQHGLRHRSAAVLSEIAQRKGFQLAAPEPILVTPSASSRPPAATPKKGPLSRPRWSTSEDAIVRKFVDRTSEDVETLFALFQAEMAKRKLRWRGRTLLHFNRRLYKLRVEAARGPSEE